MSLGGIMALIGLGVIGIGVIGLGMIGVGVIGLDATEVTITGDFS